MQGYKSWLKGTRQTKISRQSGIYTSSESLLNIDN